MEYDFMEFESNIVKSEPRVRESSEGLRFDVNGQIVVGMFKPDREDFKTENQYYKYRKEYLENLEKYVNGTVFVGVSSSTYFRPVIENVTVQHHNSIDMGVVIVQGNYTRLKKSKGGGLIVDSKRVKYSRYGTRTIDKDNDLEQLDLFNCRTYSIEPLRHVDIKWLEYLEQHPDQELEKQFILNRVTPVKELYCPNNPDEKVGTKNVLGVGKLNVGKSIKEADVQLTLC